MDTVYADRIAAVVAYNYGKVSALRELALTAWDIARCGDIAGHMRAWWQVIKGDVLV